MKVEDLILVSVDDHIIEPPTMWDQHLSAQHQNIKPKMLQDEQGADYWVFEELRTGGIGLNAVAGRVKEEYGCEPSSLSQMRAGAYDIHARIGDMNANGILASLNFPTVVTFDGGLLARLQNKENALILLRAYNDWHIDEWCGSYPGRNIPCAIIPYWDVNATVTEIKRVVAKGCHNITFSDNPATKGFPSIHDASWEPLWKVCAENDVTINIHIGSGAQAPHASMQSPIDCWIITMPISIVNSAADWLYLSALERYPTLKVALSEGGIGWIPYFLERADFTFQQHGAWTNSRPSDGQLPSERFKKHFLTCFVDDKFGLKNIDAIGEDLVSYECDYPHSDSLWPYAPERLFTTIQHLPDSVIDKVCHQNALRFLSYDPFTVLGGKQNCTVGALRAQAKAVNTEPLSFPGPSPLQPGERARVVTSGDITQMFSKLNKVA